MAKSLLNLVSTDLNDDLTGINKDLNAVDETQEKTIDMNLNILDEIDNLPRGKIVFRFI